MSQIVPYETLVGEFRDDLTVTRYFEDANDIACMAVFGLGASVLGFCRRCTRSLSCHTWKAFGRLLLRRVATVAWTPTFGPHEAAAS